MAERDMEGWLPKPPPGIWTSPPGPKQESSNPALPSLLGLTIEKVHRAPGPNSHHLYAAQGNSYSGRLADLLSHRHGATHSAVPAYSGKTKVSQVSVMGVDSLIYTPWITEPLPCTLKYAPFSHYFLILPKCPTPILGKDIFSKFKASVTIPSPPSDLAWLLHFNTHHLWCLSITTGSFLFFQTKLYEQFSPLTRNYTATPL